MKNYDILTLAKALKQLETLRIAINHQLGIDKDGNKLEKISRRDLDPDVLDFRLAQLEMVKEQEKMTIEKLEQMVRQTQLWKYHFRYITGVAEKSVGRLIGEIDIHKSTYVSSFILFNGMCPGLVRGKKDMLEKNYKPSDGKIIKRYRAFEDNKKRVVVETNILVQGDIPTEGFVRPYNAECKKQWLGIIGPSIVIAQTHPKAKMTDHRKLYDDYRNRVDNSRNWTTERRPGKGKVDIRWCDTTKKHRHDAAVRYATKQLAKETHKKWRELEGLPVYSPYEEEKLGVIHNSRKEADEATRVALGIGE